MIKNEMKIVKDGAKIRVIVNEVDNDYPPITVVGHVYVFNSRVVADKSFSTDEFTKAIGFKFNKGEVEWKE